MPDLEDLVRPGMRIAAGDGCGAPRALWPRLNEVAATHGNLRLVLGWLLEEPVGLELTLFEDVRALMPGWGLRRAVASGCAHSVPCRLSAVPALIAGPLRPDLLVCTLVRSRDGLHVGSEASWVRGLIEAGVPVAGFVSRTAPCADAGPPLPDDAITIVGEADARPYELKPTPPTAVDVAVADQVRSLIPSGARLQVGPGRIPTAIMDGLQVPVRIDSGMLTDAVVDLDGRGLLIGEPVATYLAGSTRLFEWADGRKILHPIEFTHDVRRLMVEPPLIAVNTALEIDLAGQVNVEGTASAIVGGVGGHPDYAFAGTVSHSGLSVIAVPSHHQGKPALVTRLSRPVTTASHDVDIVVSERGIADLRGLDRDERRRALLDLWDGMLAHEE